VNVIGAAGTSRDLPERAAEYVRWLKGETVQATGV
jgi:ABC-type glycerol-3-phosphate transport system substrate-binding protein